MIEKFLDYITIEKRYSLNTLASYSRDLQDFSDFVKETEGADTLISVDKKVIRNFVVYLSENNLSKRTINRKLSALRSFYIYLVKLGIISASPMETVSSLKFYGEKQIPFSQKEMENLQSLLNEEKLLLNKLIIELLYQTGMRKSELCGLTLKDVDFAQNMIRVVGKGNKMRDIPISENIKRELKLYLEKERKPTKEDSGYFFVRENGQKLTGKFVYSVVNDYLSAVTSKKKKSPHMLRHSFATHVLENGAEIAQVKEILGHASLASTQVYTSADVNKLKKVLNSFHPRGKK
ncbi:tyrosine-type recombinase/integrase [Riemerella anatipestifer]|nr:tyrosine-type recombinase/integrase [Riemerella anatipestifer]